MHRQNLQGCIKTDVQRRAKFAIRLPIYIGPILRDRQADGGKAGLMAPITYAKCKGIYRHAWDDAAPPIDYPFRYQWDYLVCLRCIRCTTQRFDGLDASGGLGRRKYKHPDDYRQPREDKPTIDELRLIIVTEGKKRRS